MQPLAIAALIIASAGVAAAQQSDTAARVHPDSIRSLAPVLVRERANDLVGYSAFSTRASTRTSTALSRVPQSVTVVTDALVADQRMQGLADVVRFIPGVTMGQGEGHRDQPTIRGNSSTADFFVDGIRDDAQYIRDLYNIERIEGIRGSNALAFGRGGGGGVINRVTREATWAPVGAFAFETGSHDHQRLTVDAGRPFSGALAGRLNGVYQNSGTYRDEVRLERFGINPTMSALLGSGFRLRAAYEFFDDHRTVDRGVPSFQGRPAVTPRSRFFGNPDSSYYDARVNSGTVVIERAVRGGIMLRNQTRAVHYDKFYQNVYPGAVDASGSRVSLSAYNNGTVRASVVNQTDATAVIHTGGLRHTLLVGAEVSRSGTDNVRRTGYFDGSATSASVPLDQPTVRMPVTFRPSATDADARTVARTAALLVQDQLDIRSWLHATAGIRAERFDLDYTDHRSTATRNRRDDMLSPRLGLVLEPAAGMSVYASYGVSYLPGSGDQFTALSSTTVALEPERFANREIGARWSPLTGLALTGALYQLDRTNSSARASNDPSLLVQTGAQRTTGAEFTATGSIGPRWQVVGVASTQRARITSATTAAAAGATVPLVPQTTASLWNRWRITPAVGLGLGAVHQSRAYAAIDNAVTLPAFTRVDAALYLTALRGVQLQANLENLFDETYFATAHSNNNITPGAPRTIRLTATVRP